MSTYLDYLPSVLRSQDLGDLLSAFEKLLGGIDDGVTAPGTPVMTTIDALPDLYDPARTPEEFLPWLAGWLGFELRSGWTTAQRRRVVAGIMRLHLVRGTSAGLAGLLELAVPVPERQRITLDAGAKVLFCRPAPGGESRVNALLSQGPYIRPAPNRTSAHSGLVSPQCIALTPDGDLVVGDAGGVGAVPAPGVWRITRTGAYADWTGGPPAPRPLGPTGWGLAPPVAVAVDPTPPGWRLYVLDVQQTGLRLSRVDSATPFEQQTVATHASVRGVVDVSAAVCAAGHLFVLNKKDERVLDIDLAAPTAVPRTIALPGLTVPRCLLVGADGRLVIGDARAEGPAELYRVDPAGGAPTPLLAGVPAADNPLLAPYAIVQEDTHLLLVLDVGLQPDQDPNRPYLRRTLRPPALYRVDLRTDPPRVTRASEPGGLVFPRGMVRQDGTVYLCDGGEPLTRDETGPNATSRRNFRASANEIGVIVHFARTGATTEDQRAALRSLADALERERPASALPTRLTAIGAN
ncbi:phage tail protein [Streptomyces chartreusis]|uniref:phage tail protein n=1 Tax=Streptomyces chartreusis TaxID=1969 RepID=UPI003865B42A|nr:phage tail protein [Streptomyces chartreusis]